MPKRICTAFDRWMTSICRKIIHRLGGYVPGDNPLVAQIFDHQYDKNDLVMVWFEGDINREEFEKPGVKKKVERQIAEGIGRQLLRGGFIKINWQYFNGPIDIPPKLRGMVVVARKSKR